MLSKHLAALASSGYLAVSKASHSGRRTTSVASTAVGRRALGRHVAALRVMIADVPGA